MRTPLAARILVVGLALAGARCGSSSEASSNDGSTLPTCTTMEGGPAMSPADFCKIFVASCPLTHDGYTTMPDCVASYTALTTTRPKQQKCQSYHLCQAVAFPTPDNLDIHCGHATGFPGNQTCELVD